MGGVVTTFGCDKFNYDILLQLRTEERYERARDGALKAVCLSKDGLSTACLAVRGSVSGLPRRPSERYLTE